MMRDVGPERGPAPALPRRGSDDAVFEVFELTSGLWPFADLAAAQMKARNLDD